MKKFLFIMVVNLMLLSLGFSTEDARLLRFPDINKDLIAFVYAGDIWTVPAAGGEARRLTSHQGMEIFPKISPDGKWIAFSGEYSGSRQIHIIPSIGGVPRQLTFYNDVGILPPRGGFDHIPLDWTPDSKQILVSANRTPYGERIGKYFLVNLEGGLETPLQIPDTGTGTFSPDAKKIVYTPISREFRTWKRYVGGRAQDIWIYDLVKNTSEQITDFIGTDQHPMWYNDKIYFVSDRDENIKLNIWSYDLKSKEFKQVTQHNEFDVLWPSGQGGLVAYENGGCIFTVDLNSGKSQKVTVKLDFDNPNRLPYFKNVGEFISRFGAALGPEGKRAIFDARGDLFSVPSEKGITLNFTRTQGIREMYPVWSPDGKWIVYESDESGDFEFYMRDPEGKQKAVPLTQGDKTWKYPPVWSPDSKMLAYTDMERKLKILDVQTKKIIEVDKAKFNDINDYSWSPDSKWVIYTNDGDNKASKIFIYSLDQKKSFNVSSGKYNDYAPVFSKCGKFIFFISDRDFNLGANGTFSGMEFDFVFNKPSRLYALALTKDAPNLFKEENDLEGIKNEEKAPAEPKKDEKAKPAKPGADGKEAEKKEAKPVVIDFDGIQARISVFPLSSGSYGQLIDIGGKILYNNGPEVRLFDLKTKDDKVVIRGVRVSALSTDLKKLLYQAGNKWGVIDIAPEKKAGDGELKMDGLVMKIDPVKEWEQIYNEGWRIYRDWFYVKNMHGVNWEKMREKYKPLLAHLGHRADLDYIFGELVGELNCGHTYVNWGDFEKVKRIDGGLLGADLKADTKAGRYIISKIYKGENWNESTRSPLTEQGVQVKEGDYIIQINGYDVTANDNPYQFLEDTAGKKISIMVNSQPNSTGAKTYWITPVSSELGLFYMDWVESRRQLVDKLSKGRVGYMHVPDTAIDGIREFFKGFYALADKEAFIIDDRNNGGGWTPGKMTHKLMEKTTNYWYSKGLEMRT